jgi:N-acyl-D-amino-acid deacylase
VVVTMCALLWVPVVSQSARPRPSNGEPFDILIIRGKVLDGTGNPWFYADVAIRRGKIAAVGNLRNAPAKRVIDAFGKIVVPGFIDLHSHANWGLSSDDSRRRSAPNLVTQGIVTVLVNQDGESDNSISQERIDLEKKGIGLNVAMLVGHNTVREQAMGKSYRRLATQGEIDEMRKLVRRGMEEGAFGLSAGLEYDAGVFSNTDEIVELVKEVAPFGGIYISHPRSEAMAPMWYVPSQNKGCPPTVLDGIRETIEIAEQTGVPAVATHLKVRGQKFWGASGAVIDMIERARARGIEVWGDEYVYNSSGSDGDLKLIPDWAVGSPGRDDRKDYDYPGALRRTLADPKLANDLRIDIAFQVEFRGGPENIRVFDFPDPAFVGKTLAQLAISESTTPEEIAIQLQLKGYGDRQGGARLRSFSLAESDIEAFMSRPWVATSTDGEISLPEEGPSKHPRFYGNYPRKIRHYVLERGVLSIEQAVRASTSLPAQILGLRDRGLIRSGFSADILIMNLELVRDRATFTEPHQYSEGMEYVLENGTFVIDGGHLTGALPGVVLRNELDRQSRRPQSKLPGS